MSIASNRAELVKALKKTGDPVIRKGQEKYFKSVLKFYGIKVPGLKSLFTDWYGTLFHKQKLESHIALSRLLLASDYGEEKYLAVMLLTKIIKKLNYAHLSFFEEMLDNHVYDWATCDGIAGKLLTEMIKTDERVVRGLLSWPGSENIWRTRAANVAFVKLARFGNHNDEIISIAEKSISCSERFVQLGAGWVLRELSQADKKRVVTFIKKHYSKFSREGLRYAIEKMEPQLRKDLLAYNQ
ncbi:MAG: DNA alkylation repair protein [Fibrobacteria bacterium]|nr:DNA alkylation repair protein [Fibrobacteria bacterium]